jgi:hypothetical protein
MNDTFVVRRNGNPFSARILKLCVNVTGPLYGPPYTAYDAKVDYKLSEARLRIRTRRPLLFCLGSSLVEIVASEQHRHVHKSINNDMYIVINCAERVYNLIRKINLRFSNANPNVVLRELRECSGSNCFLRNGIAYPN